MLNGIAANAHRLRGAGPMEKMKKMKKMLFWPREPLRGSTGLTATFYSSVWNSAACDRV
jgi:hypothetical protein